MISKAITRFIRISPRKARLVADMVRGKPIDEAQSTLGNLHKRASFIIQETLKSAIANALKNPAVSEADLYVSKVTIDGGPMFKRYKAGSMGRAMMIRHRTSHILVELDTKKKESPVAGRQSPVKEVKVRSQEFGVRSKKLKTPNSKLRTKKLVTAKRGK